MEKAPDYNIRFMRLATYEDAIREVKRIGVDSYAVPILASKALGLSIKVEHLDCAQCNIIKQTALSVGADAAVARPVVTGCSHKTDLILFCNRRQLDEIAGRLEIQPFDLRSVALGLKEVAGNMHSQRIMTLPAGELDFAQRTHVMGVLNVTPDSFSNGGEHLQLNQAVDWGMKMVEDGADIVDVGGESTRPGSESVSAEEEMDRVIPVIETLAREHVRFLSIDTQKSEVAKEAIAAGCSIVNDISGLTSDRGLAALVARKGVGLVIGHIRGTPRDMQEAPHYEDVMGEITSELRNSVQLAEDGGVDPSKIVVDPGIGFGKRLEDNLIIIRRLAELKSLGKPVMIGPSRKSFIGEILDLSVKERLEGTAAAVAIGAMNGADIVRVHDVKEMKRVCLVADALMERTGLDPKEDS